MTKIPFVEFVLRDMLQNGSKVFYTWMGDVPYLVNSKRDSLPYGPSEATQKDDWNMSVDGWIWRKIYLNRGPDYIKIKLTKEQNKLLLAAYDARMLKRAKEIRLAKETKKRHEEEMQDWP